MNVLDKIKNVQNGLRCCDNSWCRRCPYEDSEECRSELITDANEVIDALRAELKKRADKSVEAKPRFIMLTTGIVAHSENSVIWYDQSKIVVQVKDILMISDYDKCKGSMVQLKDSQQTTILVQETLEEILGKIANVKGEEE